MRIAPSHTTRITSTARHEQRLPRIDPAHLVSALASHADIAALLQRVIPPSVPSKKILAFDAREHRLEGDRTALPRLRALDARPAASIARGHSIAIDASIRTTAALNALAAPNARGAIGAAAHTARGASRT